MLRLLLLRHAKASWDDASTADIDRPLAPRGRHAAELIAQAVKDRGWLPDRILCSPSRRTRETLAALLPVLGNRTEIIIAPSLYEPGTETYREAIAADGGSAPTLMLIGHNPVMQATALAFVGGDSAAAELAAKYPAGALAVIDFAGGDWSNPEKPRLVAFLRPRDLDADHAVDEH